MIKERSRKTIRLRILIACAIASIFIPFLLHHAAHYRPFLSDDALISLRYSNRLIQGEGLSWTPGPPVEGYSNLMWILLIALLGSLGTDLIQASRILGMFCMSAVVVFVAMRYLSPKRSLGSMFGFVLGMTFFVGAAPVAVWTIGGLEQPLIAATIAGAIPLFWLASDSGYKDHSVAFALSASLGALCLTRPDGILFSAAALFSIFAGRLFHASNWPRSRVWIVLSMPILCSAGQLVFRVFYYGDWIPNSARVKFTPSPHHLKEGISYVSNGFLSLAPAILIALAFLFLGVIVRESRKRFMPILIFLMAWVGYLILIGGDIFPAYRHFVPIIVLMTYALAEGSALILQKLGKNPLKKAAFVVVLLGVVLITAAGQGKNPENKKAVDERWEWFGKALGLTLKRAFHGTQPLMAVTAAGCLPYWTEFPCLDMLGLNDRYLARHKPEDVGSGFLGHELGDGDYVLRRAPEIIIFGVGSEPAFRPGIELSSSAEFARRYVKMPVRTAYRPVYTALVWFKKDGPQIGVLSGDHSITIPAYLMNAFEHTTAFLHHGRLAVGVRSDAPAGVVLEDISKDVGITVIGDYSDRIEPVIIEKGEKRILVLSTKSDAFLPVEKVILTDLSGR